MALTSNFAPFELSQPASQLGNALLLFLWHGTSPYSTKGVVMFELAGNASDKHS